jgi:hypothetical protein
MVAIQLSALGSRLSAIGIQFSAFGSPQLAESLRVLFFVFRF